MSREKERVPENRTGKSRTAESLKRVLKFGAVAAVVAYGAVEGYTKLGFEGGQQYQDAAFAGDSKGMADAEAKIAEDTQWMEDLKTKYQDMMSENETTYAESETGAESEITGGD